MKKKIYLINPKEEDIGYFKWPNATGGRTEYVYVADLATTTVARFMEPYFDIEICEASLDEVNYDTDAEFVGITGKISQWSHMKELSEEFKKRGKTVIFGGSFASLSPDRVRAHCDILITGEIEDIADEAFQEIASGNWKSEYNGTQPNLAKTPIPKWDLYPNHKALLGAVQISRGCPFQCEFCDVIEYLGRKQRHKPIENILAELDALYKLGYREAFIADDNLTVYRKKAKEILQAVGDWNRRQTDGRMVFRTQVSIDIARDEEMMELAAYAGVFAVFIGIETPNVESLKETRKFQNLRIDLVDQVHTVIKHGFSIYGGLIVGFDNDKPDIFERQFEFVSDSAVPYVTYGLLSAPDQTPLHARLKLENRLINDNENLVAGNAYASNIIFKNITSEEAQHGSKWLMNNLYDPTNYGERLCTFLEMVGDGKQLGDTTSKVIRPVYKEMFRVIRSIRKMGEEEARMYERVTKLQSKYPYAMMHMLNYLGLYVSIRSTMHNNNTWDPSLVNRQVFA